MIPFCPACIVFTFVLFGFGIVLTLEQMFIVFIPLMIVSAFLMYRFNVYKKLRGLCDKGVCKLNRKK